MNTPLDSFTLSRRDLLFASLAGATIFPWISRAQPKPAAKPGRTEPGLRVKNITRPAV